MTSSRPYLIRALREWIIDNGMTPHLVVDTTVEGTVVPSQSIENGKITLNIADRAVGAISLGNDEIVFDARFGGRPFRVELPLSSVLAIYARENGQGMMFPAEALDETSTVESPDSEPDEDIESKRAHLRVVK